MSSVKRRCMTTCEGRGEYAGQDGVAQRQQHYLHAFMIGFPLSCIAYSTR